ncbi:hypothetical protein L6Q96_19200 [Candidatus Binatia bacterium]|nr:hypothetical protein [Candidatus Binatia bacterium]
MTTVCSLATAEIETTVSAADTREFLASMLPPERAARFSRLVDESRIRQRQALASYDDLRRLDTIEARNAEYVRQALPIAERTARQALRQAGIAPGDVDVFVVTTSTGHSVPTLDRHLGPRLGLRPDVRSLFLHGLGCAGAVRGVALAGDLLRARASADNALVVSVELASPWLQVAEPSPQDILSNIVLGDGGGAVAVGRRAPRAGLEVVAHETELWPNTLGARGAMLTQSGLRHFASPALVRTLRARLRNTVERFLTRHRASPRELQFYVLNPIDHRMLELIGSLLGISAEAMRPAWAAWEDFGNTLSAGPLYVMDALRRLARPADGSLGLVVVLGPGMTCDLMLLRWQGGL